MKVVINNDYGGFGISIEALLYLIKKKSDLVRKSSFEKYYGKDWEKRFEDEKKRGWILPFKDGFKKHKLLANLYDETHVYSIDDHEDKLRSHPDLIEVVEKLGVKANGSHATLKIVEVPDDVEWTIEEYDGSEWVSEKHQTWA